MLRPHPGSDARATNRSRGGRPHGGLDPGLIAAIPPGSVGHCGAAESRRCGLRVPSASATPLWLNQTGGEFLTFSHPVMHANRSIKPQRNRPVRAVSRLIRQGARTTKKCGSICNASNECHHARTGSTPNKKAGSCQAPLLFGSTLVVRRSHCNRRGRCHGADRVRWLVTAWEAGAGLPAVARSVARICRCISNALECVRREPARHHFGSIRYFPVGYFSW
jgi:hypothetical protein